VWACPAAAEGWFQQVGHTGKTTKYIEGGPRLRGTARENTDPLERLIDKVLIAAGLFFRFARLAPPNQR
jgi:hypothetical protein